MRSGLHIALVGRTLSIRPHEARDGYCSVSRDRWNRSGLELKRPFYCSLLDPVPLVFRFQGWSERESTPRPPIQHLFRQLSPSIPVLGNPLPH